MPDPDLLFWLLAIPAALLVGLSKGGLSSIGMLAVPVLSMTISPVTAAGLLLPIYIVSDMFGLWAFRRNYSGAVLKAFLPGAALGVLAGWLLAAVVHEGQVRLIVGVIGVAFCLDRYFRRNAAEEARPVDPVRGTFWGVLSGFTSFVSHSGAPPFQVFAIPLGLDKMAYAGTTTITFAAINLMKLPPYIALGQVSPAHLQTTLILAVVAIAGTFAGFRITRWIPERPFFILVTLGLFVVSLKLVWDGLRAVTGA